MLLAVDIYDIVHSDIYKVAHSLLRLRLGLEPWDFHHQ